MKIAQETSSTYKRGKVKSVARGTQANQREMQNQKFLGGTKKL